MAKPNPHDSDHEDEIDPTMARLDLLTSYTMGDAAGYATSGILNKFRDEFEYFIEHKRSRFNGTLECPKSS